MIIIAIPEVTKYRAPKTEHPQAPLKYRITTSHYNLFINQLTLNIELNTSILPII